jgi:hypothetical protein
MENKICDYCGRHLVGIKCQTSVIGDKDNVWVNSYDKLYETGISTVNATYKSKFYEYLLRIFWAPSMPYGNYNGSFCNEHCYTKWKKIFNGLVEKQIKEMKRSFK